MTFDHHQVAVHLTYPRGRFRIEFTPLTPLDALTPDTHGSRGGWGRGGAGFDSPSEVAIAIALGLDGARAPRWPAPALAVGLVLRGVDCHGPARVRELDDYDRAINRQVMDAGTASPDLMARKRHVWGTRTSEHACHQLARHLIDTVKTRGTLTTPVVVPA